jgi:hypothetical protein
MKLTTSKSIKYLFITHFVFLIFIALYSFFIIEKPAIQVVVPSYILISIFTIYSQLFLPISIGALFIVIIIADKNMIPEHAKENGVDMLFSTIPALIPTTLIYAFLVFFAEPVLIEKKEWLEDLSKSGEFYLKEAEKKLAEGNLEEALAFVNLYLYIDQNNRKAIDIKSDIKIAWPKASFDDEISAEQIQAVSGDIITGQILLEIAESFFEQQNYSSAAYYGQMAGGFRYSAAKANQLVKKSLEHLSDFFPNARTEENLFDGKINIVNRIESGDLNGAYYYYHSLSEQFPKDQELLDIGNRIFSILSENSFFYEDVRNIYFAPGKSEIAFINSNSSLGKELVFAKKIIFTNNGIYFFYINIINLSPSGQIERHIKSLYGKVMGNTLNMRCMGREKRLLLYPEVIIGNKSDRITSIDLKIPHEALLYMGTEESRFKKIKTPFLLENLELLSKTGAGKYAPADTLFIRFIRLFNYIFILLLTVAAGISFLKRRQTRSYLSSFIIPIAFILPIVVVAIYFIEQAIMYIKNKTLLIFMKETGITGAALCFAVIIAIELIATIFYTLTKASSIEGYKESDS